MNIGLKEEENLITDLKNQLLKIVSLSHIFFKL